MASPLAADEIQSWVHLSVLTKEFEAMIIQRRSLQSAARQIQKKTLFFHGKLLKTF
jgi:hypothetical protein